MILLSSADYFKNLPFSNILLKNTMRASNGLDPDQDRRFVGPDLGPNCFKGYQQTTKVASSKARKE